MNAFISILDCLSEKDTLTAPPGADVEQQAIVDFLCHALRQNTRPLHVEVRRAHIFWFGDVAYVLHRPLSSRKYDCATIEARWRWCEDQFRLNHAARPLPIVRWNGQLQLGGPGEICDWVLKFDVSTDAVRQTQSMRETA